jgi:hypothetical protein
MTHPMDNPLPRLYQKEALSKDLVELGEDNPWKLVEGNKVRLVCGEFSQLATVSIAAAGDAKDADHVLSSKWKGNEGIHGSLRKVSSWAFTASLLRASVKLRLGLFCAIIAIATAYINAALTKDGTVQYHLGTIRWLLFALTAASTLVAWAKDIWGQ